MGRDSEDKAGRILSIYTRLKQGKVIYKKEESIRYGVAERTIQRDIVDIQCFLEEHASTSGEIQEIIFEKALGGGMYFRRRKRHSWRKKNFWPLPKYCWRAGHLRNRNCIRLFTS